MVAQSASEPIVKSAFLDTNALIRMYIFWESCTEARVRLDAVSGWEYLKSALQSTNPFAESLSNDDAQDLKVGMRCFVSLRDRAASYQYYSSKVCRSEMHHVLLEALGSERLICRRIPRGLRIRRPQILYRRALDDCDYQKIESDIERFFCSLKEEYEINIIEIEDSGPGVPVRFDEILDTAQEIWSRMLIEVLDAYIYAAAVEIEADAFITSDGSLYDAAVRLSDASGEWRQLGTSLLKALGRPLGSSLPKATKPGHALP